MGEGIDLGEGCFEKLQSLVVSSSNFDPYRSKVAEEMLLCEVIVQFAYAKSTMRSNLLMRVHAAGLKLLSLSRQLPTNCFDIQAHMFGMICELMGIQGMVDEHRFV
jgi:hypothetical protein